MWKVTDEDRINTKLLAPLLLPIWLLITITTVGNAYFLFKLRDLHAILLMVKGANVIQIIMGAALTYCYLRLTRLVWIILFK